MQNLSMEETSPSDLQYRLAPLVFFVCFLSLFCFLVFSLLLFLTEISINTCFWLSITTSIFCAFIFDAGQINGYSWVSNQSYWFIIRLFYREILLDIGLSILGGAIIPLFVVFIVAFFIGT